MPWAAIIPAIAGIGGSIASSKISSSAQKKAQQQALNSPQALAETNLINQQAGYGKQAGDLASSLFPTYTQGVSYLGDYFKKFLGSDNTAAMEAAAPLIRLRKGQTEGLLRGLDFAPRGGGRGESLFNLRSSENSDIYDLLANERTNARSAYAGLVGDVGSRAQGLLGTASGATGGAASLLGQQIGRATQAGNLARAQSDANVRDVASGLGSILVDIIRSQQKKKGN